MGRPHRGVLDELSLDQIKQLKREFSAVVRQRAPKLVEQLRKEKKLTAELKPILEDSLKSYLQQLMG